MESLDQEIEQLKAELLIQDRQRKFLSNILKSTPLGIGVVKNNIITYVNDKFCELVDFHKEDVIGRSLSFLFCDTDSLFLNSLSTVKSGSFEQRIFTSKGNYIEILFSFSQLDEMDLFSGITFSIQDISGLKETTKALQISQKLYKNLIDTSPDLILIINEDGDIKFVSVHGSDWTVRKDDLLNNNIFNYIDKSHIKDFSILLQNVVSGYMEFDNNEFLFHEPRGREIYTEINSRLIKLEDNDDVEILLFIRNITSRKVTERALIKSKEVAEESDRLKTAFLSNMSHEIRTPMNGIMGFAQMLCLPTISQERKEYYADIIIESGKQLVGIVDSILDISKIETGQISTYINKTSINNILDELYNEFKFKVEKSNINLILRKEFSDSDSIVYSDEIKLRQIVTNLLNNACKFINKGEIEFGYSQKKDKLEFYVKDTGFGIPKEQISRIFERFHQVDNTTTRNYGGTGLGLTISKAYVSMLGGEIWVESELNVGSTFYFTIPYNPVISKTIKNNSMDESEICPNNFVLIVEDEEVNYLYLEEIMNATNTKTIHASNGREAVEMCKQYPDITHVLMDIKMPEMDGYQSLELIKKIRPDLPIIAQTAYVQPEDEVKVEKSGFDGYIKKPINIQLLIRLINKFTNTKITLE